jgi:hypothetical protein
VKRLPLVLLLVVTLAAACGSKDTTARASGIPSTTTTSTPLAAETTVLADCRTLQARPEEIIGACADAGVIFSDLQWDTWKADEATGTATVHVNLCEPNCAAGNGVILPARVELDQPVDGTFSEVITTWTGTPPFGHPTDTYELATTPLTP